MLRGARSLWRLVRIARTLQRHDALASLQDRDLSPGLRWLTRLFAGRKAGGRPGQKLARALTDLGPSFIKLGQVLSTRADLLGEEIAADLSDLQDRLPAFPTAEAKRTIESELDRPLAEIYASFEDEPVSAASIAQVHFATTPDGAPVAVKVLRPGIEAAFERDLEFFTWLAGRIERSQPKLRRFKPHEVVSLFERQVRLEMDLRMEAAAASELAENFRDDPAYRVPPVDWQRTSRQVLTMNRISGIPIDDRPALMAAGHDLEAVLTTAAEIFFKQVFRDGLFHGDQHPGNMFVDETGNIVAVDFGIMGRIDRKTRFFLADMLTATLAGDYRRLALVHVDAGYLPPDMDVDTFAQALRSVCEPIAGKPLEEISFARLLAQLLQLTESFDMPVQPSLLLLQKNMLIAEGISRLLAPGLNIWILARPLIEEWMAENRSPAARLRDSTDDWLHRLQRLPGTLDALEQAARRLNGEGVGIGPQALTTFANHGRAWTWHIRALWIGLALLALGLLATL